MSTLRRFIAGAVCPQCQETDKLFVREQAEERVCECVRCGYRTVLARDGSTGASEALNDGDAAAAPDIVHVIERAP